VAPSVGLELSPIEMRDAGELERAATEFAQSSNGILLWCMTPLLALSGHDNAAG
jgi:hypothetical protein